MSCQWQVVDGGFTRQEKAIREYAEAHGIEIAKTYCEERISGTVESCPALAAMMVSLELNRYGRRTVLIAAWDPK